MHTAAFGRILSPRRISLNCGGSYYITRNGGGHDKLVFFSDGGYPPIENKGVGGGASCTQNSGQLSKRNTSWFGVVLSCHSTNGQRSIQNFFFFDFIFFKKRK